MHPCVLFSQKHKVRASRRRAHQQRHLRAGGGTGTADRGWPRRCGRVSASSSRSAKRCSRGARWAQHSARVAGSAAARQACSAAAPSLGKGFSCGPGALSDLPVAVLDASCSSLRLHTSPFYVELTRTRRGCSSSGCRIFPLRAAAAEHWQAGHYGNCSAVVVLPTWCAGAAALHRHSPHCAPWRCWRHRKC